MMRWTAGVFGVILAAGLMTGCNRQCFLNKEVYDQAHALLPPEAERDPAVALEPLIGPTPPPATILNSDRPPRYVSLAEAIAISLENGTASGQGFGVAGNGPGNGTYSANLVQGTSIGTSPNTYATSQTDYIRVLALTPAFFGTNMEAALSRFDTQWVSSMNWTATDNLQQGLNSFNNGESATFLTSLIKPLASGGFAHVTFQENYQLLSNPPTTTFSVLNPSYQSQLSFGIDQPLWRNFGSCINQVLPGLFSPTSQFTNLPSQAATALGNRLQGATEFGNIDGILIARLRFDQSRADFERNIQNLVLQVEVAYWNLYNAYGQLYAFDESLRIAHRAWMIEYAKLQTGKSDVATYAPVLAQYEQFRGQRATALGAVLDAERNLRGILGIPVEDGCRIVPVTPPSLAPFQPDWVASLRDALYLKPELLLARDNLRLAQYNLEVAENFLKPDLRFGANYTPLGFGTTLTGRGTFADATGATQPSNSLQSLASGRFANWNVGLTLNMPLGFRLENANVRAARLGLAQSFYLVKDQEMRVTQLLTQQYQKVQEWYKRIETSRAERKAYADAVEVRFKKILAGAGLADISFLDFQVKLADAQVKEYQAIAEYNNSLARLEWTKGTILKYDNVHIAEGPMPQCAQVRAVEHEKERSEAIVLKERPDPLYHPGRLANPHQVPFSETPPPNPLPLPPGAGPEEKMELMPAPRPAGPPLGEPVAPKTSGPVPALPPIPALPGANQVFQTPPAGADAVQAPAVLPPMPAMLPGPSLPPALPAAAPR
jgi:outer membrane protein TolC